MGSCRPAWRAVLVCGLGLLATWLTAEELGLTGADWELRVLGVRNSDHLAQLRALANRRPVTLAIVGQGGVSKSLLEPVLIEGTTLEYRMWPPGTNPDPASNTHDTAAARVILDLTHRLGIQVRVLVYHASDSWDNVAEAFAKAGAEADMVASYQSFWGDVSSMAKAIGDASRALFISPYAEFENRPTRTCIQGYSARPWDAQGRFAHFITAAPLARTAPGAILTPSSRPDEDTEIINFIAPSYYANGPGGTCPAAEVTAAVAAYIIAASQTKPDPVAIVQLMRDTVKLDRAALTSVPEFTEQMLAPLAAQITALANPGEGKDRKLDAAGVLNLAAVFDRLKQPPTDP